MTLANDGAFAATGGTDGIVQLWRRPQDSAPRNDAAAVCDPHDPISIDAVRFTRDNRYLVTASNRGVLRIWDVGKARLAAGVTPDPEFAAARFSGGLDISSNGRFAFLGGFAAASRIDVATLTTTPIVPASLTLEPQQSGIAFVTSAAVADDGNDIVLGGGRGTVLHWRTGGGIRPSLTLQARITAVAISRDGRRAAAAGISGTPSTPRGPLQPLDVPVHLRVWDLATSQDVFRIDFDGVVSSLAFDESGNRLLVTPRVNPLSGECASAVNVWDLERRRSDLDIRECARVAVFGVGGKHIVTHSLADDRIRIRSDTGSVIVMSQPVRDLSALAVSPDSLRLAAGTAAGVEVFDLRSLDRLLVMATRGRPERLRFSSDGSQLIAIVGDDVLRAFDSIPAYRPDVRVTVRQLLSRPDPARRPAVQATPAGALCSRTFTCMDVRY